MKKISKNAPCPCKSGKKYKKCCLPRRLDGANKETVQISEPNDKPNFGKEDAEMMHNMLWNMRNFLLEKKPHIKAYKKVRKLHGEVLTSMMQYYDDGKFEKQIDYDYKIPDSEKDANTERVVTLLDINFDFSSDIGNQAFVDFMVYKSSPNFNSITEEFISKNRYRKPEKKEFLQSMLESVAGLYKVISVDKDEGYANLEEVFTGEKHKIVDIGLSGNSTYDKHYLYARIISYQGISLNAGTTLAIKSTDPFIRRFIKKEKEDYKRLGEFVRFIELYNHYVNKKRNTGVQRNYIK